MKSGQLICVLGVEDAAFLSELADRVPDFVREKPLGGTDVILLGAENLKALTRVKSLASAIQKAGAIWIVYPKGQKHIREVGRDRRRKIRRPHRQQNLPLLRNAHGSSLRDPTRPPLSAHDPKS